MTRDGTRSGFSRPDPTGKFQNHSQMTGRSTDFFTEVFTESNEKFSKGEGLG